MHVREADSNGPSELAAALPNIYEVAAHTHSNTK